MTDAVAVEDLRPLFEERDALRAEVARLRAALEEADSALACASCAQDPPPCHWHGDPHAKIAEALKGGAS